MDYVTLLSTVGKFQKKKKERIESLFKEMMAKNILTLGNKYISIWNPPKH